MAEENALDIMKGNIVDGNGADFTIPESVELVGLYFSAHWCPPCRGFTPVLAEYYKAKVEEGGKSYEIVFVSSDRDEESFNEYFASMPWKALKFSAKDDKEKLSQKFGIRGIPTLVVVNRKGEVVHPNARDLVTSGIDW